MFPRALGFWLLAFLLALYLAAASAPSPLYSLYAGGWHFSPATLTGIYAVYAFGALGALLLFGRLSDHLGRRPVVVTALIVQVAAMALFVLASGPAWLFAARFVQGVATGIASSALTAWIIDSQPASRPGLGSLVGGIALIAGLGSGALVSGLLVQFAPDPLHLVYWLFIALFAMAVPAVVAIPDAVQRRPGWAGSLRPQVGVPAAAMSTFAVLAPSVVALWALGGLYLSLGPSLAIAVLHAQNHLAGGLAIGAVLGTGAVASATVATRDPRGTLITGLVVLMAGVAVTLAAVVLHSGVTLFAGSFLAGIGFGPAWSGVFRSLAGLAPPERRAALLSAVYVTVYLAFSLPAILAGVGATAFGLPATTLGYGVLVIVLAALTTAAYARRSAAARA